MKLCQMCQTITADEQNYCAHDGQPLEVDALATTLQESVGAKYTITRLIGTGSMGAVYGAQHHALGDVAIKVMLGPPDNHKLSERFLREAKALRKLHNPHSVLIYDLERSATGLTYMVMEMLKGRSLRDELRERGRLSLEEAMEIAESVCDALEAAHERGIIHRDLKPDNILLADDKTGDGDSSRFIKIVDFGIVKLRGTQQGGEEASMQLTKHGSPIGTPFYMSPEQWFGDGPPGYQGLDKRTDIYALGCTLYEALSGSPPFVGNTKEDVRRKHLEEQPRPLSDVALHVPESISRVIMRALEKDRDVRPASATEFAVELRRAFEEHKETTINKDERKGLSEMPESSASVEESLNREQISQLQATYELMLAQAGAWRIGVFAEEVESVTAWRSPVPLPHAPPAVMGVVSVRGRMLTVIDPAMLLGEASPEKTEDVTPAFIIALRGDEQLALAVNRVDGHLGIYLGEIAAPTGTFNSNLVRGIVQGAHGQTIVLDIRELFAAAMQGAERRRQRLQKQNPESRIQNPE